MPRSTPSVPNPLKTIKICQDNTLRVLPKVESDHSWDYYSLLTDFWPRWLRVHVVFVTKLSLKMALVRFDLPLQRAHNTAFTVIPVGKKWFPRNFSLRVSRVYFSHGENVHHDTARRDVPKLIRIHQILSDFMTLTSVTRIKLCTTTSLPGRRRCT